MCKIKIFFGGLFASFFIASIAIADASIKGTVLVIDGEYYVEPEFSTQRLKIVIPDEFVRNRLKCLNEGDFIWASAKRFSQDFVVISSINYVGLKRLIAAWRNESEVFKFSDFRNFYYWNFNPTQIQFQGPFKFHYALSPDGDNPHQCLWKIFIIDSEVVLGSLEWTAEDQIHIKVYDTVTGEISYTKHLIKGVF
jgi:hypothetical protein